MYLAVNTANEIAKFFVIDKNGKIEKKFEENKGRRLAADILTIITDLIGDLKNLNGIIVFRGPGSFTGLRIGITTANSLSYALEIPIVGEVGENWIAKSLTRILQNENDKIVLPEYGGEANITKARK